MCSKILYLLSGAHISFSIDHNCNLKIEEHEKINFFCVLVCMCIYVHDKSFLVIIYSCVTIP